MSASRRPASIVPGCFLCLIAVAVASLLLLSPLRGLADEVPDFATAIGLANDPNELAHTWDRGFVALPATAFGPQGEALFGMIGQEATAERLAEVPDGARIPVLVYLHGCAGFGTTAAELPILAEQAGFAVIAPDSFGRSQRRRNCNTANHSSGMFPAAWLYRRAELLYALERTRQLPWVDQDKVLLAGFSEGAAAVALWGGLADVAGYVVLGWTCTAPSAWDWLHGLRTPADRPVLAIVSRGDPWSDWPGWRGDCGSVDPTRFNVDSMILERTAHEVLNYPEAREALVTFLARWSD